MEMGRRRTEPRSDRTGILLATHSVHYDRASHGVKAVSYIGMVRHISKAQWLILNDRAS
jgi:hypothetical protein